MLSNDSCRQTEALRDYAFDELPAGERRTMEQHLAACGECALELDRLRLTTAALHALPDRDIPQRIAFVSDRVFEPSLFRRFWNSAPRLGFASAAILSVAMLVSAWHVSGSRPATVNPVVQTASVSQQRIDDAIAKAVAQVKAQVKAEDAQITQAAIQASERKQEAEYRNQMVAIQENFMVLQKRLNVSYARLWSSDAAGAGVGQ